MKRNVIALALALGTAACATASNDRPEGPVATEADIPAAHAALKRSLKDPESVRYVSDTFKPGVVCGLFNSKNSYGGYGGNTLYLIAAEHQSLLIDGRILTLVQCSATNWLREIELPGFQRRLLHRAQVLIL